MNSRKLSSLSMNLPSVLSVKWWKTGKKNVSFPQPKVTYLNSFTNEELEQGYFCLKVDSTINRLPKYLLIYILSTD